MSEENSKKIAELNDRFRLRFGLPCFEAAPAVPGQIVTTRGIAALSPEIQVSIWQKVRTFSEFTEDNDPQGEHDFGAFDIAGAGKIFWKIDYYADGECGFGSENPTDPAQSFRVLTILLASEN